MIAGQAQTHAQTGAGQIYRAQTGTGAFLWAGFRHFQLGLRS